MYVPDDPPAACPACGDPYESVSRHAGGFAVNLLDNGRYRRVCFHPATADGDPALDCYHHTHADAGTGTRDAAERGSADADPDTDADAVVPAERS
ncbi:hypothetical protein ACFPM1_08335 [Halorubrum rubrum]|uniref:DUF8145 domain-containing protein n=1 Tax=Halorubrum rubrum TaxID=1126240 RepID=A0ABD5R1A2_9EURY|nr:hypothetical protein [Halorubrum rubrum]